MKRLPLILAALSITALAATPAKADANWTGCYGKASAGYSVENTEAELTSPFVPGFAANFDGLGSDGASFGLGAGCDVLIQNNVVAGIYGGHSWMESTWQTTLTGGGTANISYDLEDRTTVGARLGVLVGGGDTLLYGLVGYSWRDTSDIQVSFPGPAIPGISFADLEGWTVGGGVEANLTGPISFDLRYEYTDYDDVNTTLFPGLDLRTNTDEHLVTGALVYKFGRSEVPALLTADPLK